MFAVVPFENDPVSEDLESLPAVSSSNANKLKETVHFHTPGMAEFSVVAGASHESDSFFDPRLFNGDSWLTSECHCLKCEGLRMVQKIQPLLVRENSLSDKPVVLLLDLDNFGFRQFQLAPPRLPKYTKISNSDIISSVFVWGFFGSCFTRYHKVWPTDELLKNSCLEEVAQEKSSNAKSIWQLLVNQNRVLLTPCSGANQGADSVMKEVAFALSETYNMILVTGDVALIDLLREEHRLHRKRSSREEDDKNSKTPNMQFINVLQHNKKLVPTWHAIGREVMHFRKGN